MSRYRHSYVSSRILFSIDGIDVFLSFSVTGIDYDELHCVANMGAIISLGTANKTIHRLTGVVLIAFI